MKGKTQALPAAGPLEVKQVPEEAVLVLEQAASVEQNPKSPWLFTWTPLESTWTMTINSEMFTF